jgi:Bacterial TSP3 repeat
MALLVLALAYFVLAPPPESAARDRDNDGLPDRWERRYDLSTSKKSGKGDPDDDGLRNLREHDFHTNPRQADTDGDGFDDRAEFHARTDPRDPASYPTTPPPGECDKETANVRDGVDRWGGCFPGASNTGVPDGTALTAYTGPCRITTAGTVIDGQRVNCSLEIVAQNVEVRNSEVNGTVGIDGPDRSLTVVDSTLDAGPVNANTNDGPRAICCRDFTLVRVETVRGISGGWCEASCTVRDSWIHGQDRDEGGHAHQSGFRLGSGGRFIHNTIRCDAPEVPPDAGCSADVTGYGDFDYIRNNLVEKNLLEWTESGGFCAYGGSTPSKPYSAGSNNVWQDNIFQRGPSGQCGVYGAITDGDFGKRGNEWTNNRWDTGESINAGG